MVVDGQCHALAYLPQGKRTGEAGLAPHPVWVSTEKRKSQLWTVQPLASCSTDYAMLSPGLHVKCQLLLSSLTKLKLAQQQCHLVYGKGILWHKVLFVALVRQQQTVDIRSNIEKVTSNCVLTLWLPITDSYCLPAARTGKVTNITYGNIALTHPPAPLRRHGARLTAVCSVELGTSGSSTRQPLRHHGSTDGCTDQLLLWGRNSQVCQQMIGYPAHCWGGTWAEITLHSYTQLKEQIHILTDRACYCMRLWLYTDSRVNVK